MPPFLVRPSLAGLPPSRRDWLRIGVPAAVGGMLAGLVRANSVAARARSVIVVFASGGQSQAARGQMRAAPSCIAAAIFFPSALTAMSSSMCRLLPG